METITSFPGRDGHVGDPVRLGIVTVSDRASRGEYTDEGGPAILAFFKTPSRVRGRPCIDAFPTNAKPWKQRCLTWRTRRNAA